MTWAPRPLAFGAIDDHPVILTGLAEGLRPRLPAGSRLWPVARTVSELLAWPDNLDVVLMDLELHDDTDPADNVVKLRARGWPVIIFTQDPRHAKVARAFRSGASGLLSKSEDLDVIAQALLVVASGEGYLSKEWASAIAADLELVAPALSEREFAAVQLYAGGAKAHLGGAPPRRGPRDGAYVSQPGSGEVRIGWAPGAHEDGSLSRCRGGWFARSAVVSAESAVTSPTAERAWFVRVVAVVSAFSAGVSRERGVQGFVQVNPYSDCG